MNGGIDMTGIKILVVDDEAAIRKGLRKIFESEGSQVELAESGQAAMEMLQQNDFHVVITDLKMPGMSGVEVLKAIQVLQPEVPVIIITGYSTVDSSVETMKIGAFDYLPKPFTPDEIIEKVRKAHEHRSFMVESLRPVKNIRDDAGLEIFVGDSEEMQKVYLRISKVAPTDSTVLITGESGTGKELVARATHDNSPRRHCSFIAVDCTSLVENLLESELFGHVKGSFTGAIQTKMGLFKVADGGTLFLDEISNISLTTQAKLLRVLQERSIVPIGDTKPIAIDIRLIAATNRDLKEMVEQGSFREDLYYRLNIIPVHLPPLRERRGDLPVLASHFLKKFADEMGRDIKGMVPGAISMLEQYDFPGNVRELENIIERSVVLARGNLIQPEELEIQIPDPEELPAELTHIPETADELKQVKKKIRRKAIESVERAFLIRALDQCDWNVTRAAERVGMQRPNFQALLKKQEISIRGKKVDA